MIFTNSNPKEKNVIGDRIQQLLSCYCRYLVYKGHKKYLKYELEQLDNNERTKPKLAPTPTWSTPTWSTPK